MKKKFLLSFMLVCASLFTLGIVSVSAETYGDLTYTVFSNEVTITDCNVSATKVEIPNTIEGYPVTAIGGGAFYNCSSLISVTIPGSVTAIGGSAFESCSNLINITLPDVVTAIGDGAFYGCSSLKSITIPDSVTAIGDGAFHGCSSLKSITIPDNVMTVGGEAFFGCSALTSVYISNIEAWCRIEFENVYANPMQYASNLYLNGSLLTDLIIPDSITIVNDYVFYNCSSLISVTIPDSVTAIGDRAFEGCSSLISVTIPDSVTAIGVAAFCGCSGLISVTIPDSVTAIGDWTFEGCSSLISVTIPDSVTAIGDGAFEGCSSLKSITISDNVTAIGDSAFRDCSSLKSITIPDSVITIEANAFWGCSALTSVYISNIEAWCKIEFGNGDSNPMRYASNIYFNGKVLTSLIIPDSITTVNAYAFYHCISLTNITIPDSVTSIGQSAFCACYNLTNVSVGSGIKTIPESAFRNCSHLKYVCLPRELLYIRNDAFNGCSNIETVFYTGSETEWDSILKYNRNENLTQAKILYNSVKKTYRFNTGCDTLLPDVTDYAVFAAPSISNGDKKLVGWYDNKSFSGNPVEFPYYGTATALYAEWTDKTGLSFDDAFTAKPNQKYTVTTTTSGQLIYYEFVPRLTGEYRFYSVGNKDTYGYLYNSAQKQLKTDDDSGEGNNFYISYTLNAGEKYYIAAKCYNGTGTFTLVTETDCVEGTKTVCVTATSGETIFITTPRYLPKDVQIILACYQDNKLVETRFTKNQDETIYFIVNNKFDSAKVMVWESMDSLKSVCDAELVQ